MLRSIIIFPLPLIFLLPLQSITLRFLFRLFLYHFSFLLFLLLHPFDSSMMLRSIITFCLSLFFLLLSQRIIDSSFPSPSLFFHSIVLRFFYDASFHHPSFAPNLSSFIIEHHSSISSISISISILFFVFNSSFPSPSLFLHSIVFRPLILLQRFVPSSPFLCPCSFFFYHSVLPFNSSFPSSSLFLHSSFVLRFFYDVSFHHHSSFVCSVLPPSIIAYHSSILLFLFLHCSFIPSPFVLRFFLLSMAFRSIFILSLSLIFHHSASLFRLFLFLYYLSIFFSSSSFFLHPIVLRFFTLPLPLTFLLLSQCITL